MIKIFRRNKYFIIFFLILWSTAFIARLFLEKGDFLMHLSTHHTWSNNQIFSLITQLAEGHIFVVVVLIFLFVRYKSSIAIASAGVFVMILANILKNFFSYERPFLYFKNLGLEHAYQRIEGIEPYVGLTSFPSGHTMAGFALMFVLSYYLKSRFLELVFLLLAILVGISRIYLGHHFLEDVILGSIVGVVVAMLTIYFVEKWKAPTLENSLMDTVKSKA